jgi:hypothetical protein
MLCALGAFCSVLSFAENWTGRLIDASCYDQQKNATACDPTASTTMFALHASGKVYKLDDAGNAKAVEAIRNRADRSKDPTKPASPEINAKVKGSKGTDDTIKVEAIEVE